MKRTIPALLVACAVAGCASSGTRVDTNTVAGFQAGQTTYADAVTQLGPPNGLTVASNGSRVAVYTFAHASTRAASFIPVVGLFAGGADVHAESVILRFAPNGTFIEASFTQTKTGTHAGF